MPLYEFECKSCHDVVEILVRHAEEKPECPACGSHQLDQLLSVPATPAVASGNRLPVAARDSGEACGMPRCCGGGCQL